MNKYLFSLIFLILHFITNGQKLYTEKSIETIKSYYLYDKTYANDTFFYSNRIFWIRLMGDYNDSAKVFINKNLVLDDLLVTNQSIGLAKDFGTSFQKKTDTIELKIIIPKRNICLTEILNLNYPLVEIYLNGKWKIIYTNHFTMLE